MNNIFYITIISILALIILFVIILMIIYRDLLPPLTPSFLRGEYHCGGRESMYMDYKCPLYEFEPGLYQQQNSSFLAILNYNTSVQFCNNKSFSFPDELLPSYTDIMVDDIRYGRVYYIDKRDTLLIYMQSMKYSTLLYNTLRFNKVDFKHTKVYAGIWDVYNRFRHTLLDIIKIEKPSKVVFFGHSMGGTLSNFGAIDLIDNFVYTSNDVFVYTYGSLPPGDKDFAQLYDTLVPNTFTINNGEDLTIYPLIKFGFVHVGKPIYVDFSDVGRYYNHGILDYATALSNMC